MANGVLVRCTLECQECIAQLFTTYSNKACEDANSIYLLQNTQPSCNNLQELFHNDTTKGGLGRLNTCININSLCGRHLDWILT